MDLTAQKHIDFEGFQAQNWLKGKCTGKLGRNPPIDHQTSAMVGLPTSNPPEVKWNVLKVA